MAFGIGSRFLRNGFSTASMREIFSDTATIRDWAMVEAALASAQASAGVIPLQACEAIVSACEKAEFDLERIEREIQETGHLLVPFVREIARQAGPAGAWVHWGATTQDIVDTAAVLQMKRALQEIDDGLHESIMHLKNHAAGWSHFTMAGRTHGQHALPVTLGYKAAVWIDELERVALVLQDQKRNLCGSLFGAVGTSVAYGPQAENIRRDFCRRLDLHDCDVPWHTSRDRIRSILAGLDNMSCAAERIAAEIVRLQTTELAELYEPASSEHVGSSTMPQKRNPIASETVVAACRLMRSQTQAVTNNSIHAFERDAAAWSVEWIAIPNAFVLAAGIVAGLKHITHGLSADRRKMASNLEITQGRIMAESVMMQLGEKIGHEHAHHLVMQVIRTQDTEKQSFRDALNSNAEITRHLDPNALNKALEIGGYLGLCERIVETVLARPPIAERRAPA